MMPYLVLDFTFPFEMDLINESQHNLIKFLPFITADESHICILLPLQFSTPFLSDDRQCLWH